MRPPQAYPPTATSSELTLAALPTAVTCAKLFLRYTLANWRLEPPATAEAAVTELVSGAVEQTGIVRPSPTWTQLADLALIRVRLLLLDDGLVVEVLGHEYRQRRWIAIP